MAKKVNLDMRHTKIVVKEEIIDPLKKEKENEIMKEIKIKENRHEEKELYISDLDIYFSKTNLNNVSNIKRKIFTKRTHLYSIIIKSLNIKKIVKGKKSLKI